MIEFTPNLKLFLYVAATVLGVAFLLNAVGAAGPVITGVSMVAGIGMYALRSKLP